jgi:hypothetical protein
MDTTTRTPQSTVALTGLVVATPQEWETLDYTGKAAYLAQLDLIGVKAQASVLAAAGRRPLVDILRAWVQLGYIDAERAQSVYLAQP